MNEIKQLENILKRKLPNANLEILPLHSDIVIDQQKRVFLMSKPTYRKVIISTSIAESSITVPDIKYVIDFCLTKELWCDPYTNYTHLRVEWTSQSSIEQRKGAKYLVQCRKSLQKLIFLFFQIALE
jgi:ATP-dependent RNA helicase TDRD9